MFYFEVVYNHILIQYSKIVFNILISNNDLFKIILQPLIAFFKSIFPVIFK